VGYSVSGSDLAFSPLLEVFQRPALAFEIATYGAKSVFSLVMLAAVRVDADYLS
jgi:hypothetical protein